jgi:hypothetical protein
MVSYLVGYLTTLSEALGDKMLDELERMWKNPCVVLLGREICDVENMYLGCSSLNNGTLIGTSKKGLPHNLPVYSVHEALQSSH